MARIVIFTDGGCLGNPGPGAWAFVAQRQKERVYRSGGERQTTNNRMELTAVIRALEYVLSDPELRSFELAVHTDSQYVKRGITEWIRSWVRKGWKTSTKQPVKNQDLWKRLLALTDGATIRWEWVRGHAGNDLNELCDRLVKGKMREITRGR